MGEVPRLAGIGLMVCETGLDRVEWWLAMAANPGYDSLELNVSTLQVITEGGLLKERVQTAAESLQRARELQAMGEDRSPSAAFGT